MKHLKLKASDTIVDHRYQRELDVKRVESIARKWDWSLLGVPVVSKRSDGSHIRLDGQHRLAACIAAGHGDVSVMMQVHEGLSVQEEAALFLQLNGEMGGSRKAVGKIDRFKARIVAKEPTALEIQGILHASGCKVARSQQRGGIMAVEAVERAYHKGNLALVLSALVGWLDGEPESLDGAFIDAVSLFMAAHPDADPAHLSARLQTHAPQKLKNRLRRERQQATSKSDAARMVLGEIYNFRTPKPKRVSPRAA